MSSPTADVSVRVAWVDDAPAIAELQLRTWRDLYAGLVPDDVLPSGSGGRRCGSRGLEGVVRQPARRPQPGAGRPRAQPGRRLRDHLPRLRPRLRPGRRRRADGVHRRSRRARQGARLPAAPGGRRHDARRPVHPGGPVGDRHRRRPAGVPRPTPAGRPTPPTASSTWTATAPPSSSRSGCTQPSPRPLILISSETGSPWRSTPDRGTLVFGPLPRLHRLLVVVTTVLVGIVAGVWAVHETPLPALLAAGIAWGLARRPRADLLPAPRLPPPPACRARAPRLTPRP